MTHNYFTFSFFYTFWNYHFLHSLKLNFRLDKNEKFKQKSDKGRKKQKFIKKSQTYITIAATTTRPERPFNPVSNSTSLLRFFPLTILCRCDAVNWALKTKIKLFVTDALYIEIVIVGIELIACSRRSFCCRRATHSTVSAFVALIFFIHHSISLKISRHFQRFD